MPIEADRLTTTSLGSTSGSLRASSTRCAIAAATASWPGRSVISRNSSPPTRATVSSGRAMACRRRPISRSTVSPATWPNESLTGLKPSRSMNITASALGSGSAPIAFKAAAMRSSNISRLGMRVSGSEWAWSRRRLFASLSDSASSRLRVWEWVSSHVATRPTTTSSAATALTGTSVPAPTAPWPADASIAAAAGAGNRSDPSDSSSAAAWQPPAVAAHSHSRCSTRPAWRQRSPNTSHSAVAQPAASSAADSAGTGSPCQSPAVAGPPKNPRRAISNIPSQPAASKVVWTAQRTTSGQARRAAKCSAATTVAAASASPASDVGWNCSPACATRGVSAARPSAQLPHRPAPTQHTLANHQTSTDRRSRERMRRSEHPSSAKVSTPSSAIGAQSGQARESVTTRSGKRPRRTSPTPAGKTLPAVSERRDRNLSVVASSGARCRSTAHKCAPAARTGAVLSTVAPSSNERSRDRRPWAPLAASRMRDRLSAGSTAAAAARRSAR